MPPVLGPASPSPTRLKSWAGTSGTAVYPSVIANSETSGPSRYSSTTTAPPARARHAAAWSRAACRSSVTTTPLPAGEPVVLDHVRGAELVERVRRPRSMVVHTCAMAVGTPASAMTCLAKAFEPSSCAAAPDGPNVANPAPRRASATPATSGASGPITTRSTASSRARRTTSSGSVAATAWLVPTSAVPALPGATCTAATAGSAASDRARACSRPPEPITRMSTPAGYPSAPTVPVEASRRCRPTTATTYQSHRIIPMCRTSFSEK